MWEQIKIIKSDFSEPVKCYCSELLFKKIMECYYDQSCFCFGALHHEWMSIHFNQWF
jgi:hypothetical protein